MKFLFAGWIYDALWELAIKEKKSFKGLVVDILVEHLAKNGYNKPDYYQFPRERNKP